MKTSIYCGLCAIFAGVFFQAPADAGVIEVNYVGAAVPTGDPNNPDIGASGLKASAIFESVTETQLRITLRNESIDPFGDANGQSAMVLSSINFALPYGIEIDSGMATIAGGSGLVENSSGAWTAAAGTSTSDDINSELFFSNNGLGNFFATRYSNVNPLEQFSMSSAVTSLNQGDDMGNPLMSFDGTTSSSDTIDYGLVAADSEGFGAERYIRSAVVIDLELSGAIDMDLSFLQRGSYVEFGSSDFFVSHLIGDVGSPVVAAVPEPTSLLCWLGLLVIPATRRRRSK